MTEVIDHSSYCGWSNVLIFEKCLDIRNVNNQKSQELVYILRGGYKFDAKYSGYTI